MTGPNPSIADLQAPATTTATGLTVGLSAQSRLELAMRRANEDDPDGSIPTPGSGGSWASNTVGVPNPYGKGIRAYEPNNIILDAYTNVKNEYDARQAAEAAAKAATQTIPGVGATSAAAGGTVPVAANGQVKGFIDAAMQLAQRRVPYVWGGTSSSGVDCSGLIYYAARAAGIQLDGKAWPRLRAVDYGRLGQAVDVADARPGDLIYFDEKGDTDHVGIYIGNGQMIQAPTSGDVVKVSGIGKPTSIRRVFDDGAFGAIATPTGGQITSYGGSAYQPAVGQYNPGTTLPGLTQALGSTITRGGSSGRSRAI